MFIKHLSVVDIVAGSMAGRRGVVREIKIIQESGAVVVFVDVFNLQTGGVDLMMFEPLQLKRSQITSSKAERLQMLAQVVGADQ